MKSDFYIDRVGKEEIKELLYTYHYLKDESKDFKSGFNYGLFRSSVSDVLRVGGCMGACVFTGLPVPELGYVKGNVRVISYKANIMKSDATIEEIKLFAKNVVKYLQE